MRRLGVFVVLAVITACSGGRQTVRQQMRTEQVRVDSLAAIMAENLHVCLHDVVIAPADSPRVCVYVREVELTRDRAARVETHTHSQTQTEAASEQIPAPGASLTRRLSFVFGALVAAICLVAIWRKRR